ncbi:unnamed protein product [Brassicogethes aeneus]|uniref:Adhesion G protein-coupled receptor A3 n=1 Tax=Brassicogethes aeneus TaxID=1431903 RepID=A0A9P0B1P6_BRAAE|nr:unnamed protein product [Brassicogethes aeneus]
MKMRSVILNSVLLILLSINTLADEYECPNKCNCKRNVQKDGGIKIKCGETEKITDVEELEFLNIANEIVQLNLSDNLLKSFKIKVELITLQKLDLSRNKISSLKSRQFVEVPSLRRLDLSGNNIKYIDTEAFANLKHLERLKLNQNQINSISLGTFDPFTNLKQIDISGNPLNCDCGLLWLLDWTAKKGVKLISNPICNSPPEFNDIPLRKIKVGEDIHCKSPIENNGFPMLEMRPSENQVVFEGDKLQLQCRIPLILDSFDSDLDSKIEWKWLDSDPKKYFNDIIYEKQQLPREGLSISILTIKRLKQNHTGIWNCQFLTNRGNHSKEITVVVISNNTKYCPMTVSTNNKGTYNWPRTLVNYTVTIPCESLNLNYDVKQQKASYSCSKQGEWKDLNTSYCSYISDTTKILEQFSKVNSSILESAKHFRNYTSNLKLFRDVMDLIYAVTTIENYLKYPRDNLAVILADVANNLLDLPKSYFRKADLEYRISSVFINITEVMARQNLNSQILKSNLALEVFPEKKDGFAGMTCTWYINPNNHFDSLFSCATNNQIDALAFQGKIAEASITIPDTLFHQLQEDFEHVLPNKAYSILIAMHANNKLFPVDDKLMEMEDITSAVVGVKLVEFDVTNLTEPIYVMLRTPASVTYEVTPFIPVWWNPYLNNHLGGWSREGCTFSHELQDHLVFSCNQFGYFGLLQDVTHLQDAQVGAKFKWSHPAIYVGSFILFASLLIIILTYLLCYTTIQMPKKAKHSLINMWISISLLCFMYVFGIYQTEDVKVCQTVGMSLHYLSLCSLLWMCVGVNCMYKRLSKNDIIDLQDDDLPSDQPIEKPILGLYLVGWGVGLIICGLSAAINMNEYASATHCFLRTGPALSALYIPFAILMIFLIIFFLLIRCAIYNLDANGHLSEGTQATEHVDLDLLEPNFPNMETGSIRSVSSKTASSEVEDPEHAPAAQLKAYIIFVLLYLATWLSCAFSTVPPFNLVSFEEDLFSIAFAILSTTLSAFTLFFYCVARNDVRTQWVVCNKWWRAKRIFRSRNVHDTTPAVPQIQQLPLPPIVVNTEHQVLSRSSSRTSTSHTKSNSHNSNILKGAVDLNGSYSDGPGAKINNVNLVVLHRAQYRSNLIPNIIENPTNAAEVFYNPHQSTVARKFFKRQKRHQLKKNNLQTTRPRDLNSDTASIFSEPKALPKQKNSNEQSMFGTNSKVNNTNIHVEQVRKIQQTNPNIFSDSADEYHSLNNVPMENIVINAERLRRKEILKNKTRKKYNLPASSQASDKNLRSVSQQCTLEYSSENISDSILDKASPEKSLLPNQVSFLTENSEQVPSIRRENSPMGSLSVTTEDFKINDIQSITSDSTINNDYFNEKYDTCRRNTKPQNLPSEISFSVIESSVSGLNESIPRIYINPSHNLEGVGSGSRASSVSVSDIDELYQQIRRGPEPKLSRSLYVNSHQSPCLSDSEINSYVIDNHHRPRRIGSCNIDNISDVETTV